MVKSDSEDSRPQSSPMASSHRRFYCDRLAARQVPFEVELAGSEAHHALHVLRLSAGQAVELFDGKGLVAQSLITKTTRRSCLLEVADVIRCPVPPSPQLHVAAALAKSRRLDWMLEKLTELSVVSFTPLICQRSSVELKAGRNFGERFDKICISAARQSGCNFLPQLNMQFSFEDFFSGSAAGDSAENQVILAHCDKNLSRLGSVLRANCPSVTIVIGPEGGFTDAECQLARDSGADMAVLGDSILRIETAAIAMAAAVKALCGA